MAENGSSTLAMPYRILMGAFFLSNVGTGAVLPFTALLITGTLGLGYSAVAVFFAASAITGLLAGMASGPMVDRYGARPVGAAGFLVAAAGYGLLTTASTLQPLILAGVVVGLSDGLYRPAFTPAVAQLVPRQLRRRAFSTRYFIMNAGIGTGTLIASVAAEVFGPERLRGLFLVNALTFLPMAVVFWWALRSSSRTEHAPEEGETPLRYRALLRSKEVWRLLMFQLLVAGLGFALFETAVPIVMRDGMNLTLSVVGAMVATNTAAVVAIQAPFGRWLERFSEVRVLASTGVIWSAAFALGAVAARMSGAGAVAMLMAVAVVFAFGEATYGSAFHARLTHTVNGRGLGRASALSTMAWSAGLAAGPALGVQIAAGLGPTRAWLVMASLVLVLPLLLVHSGRDITEAPRV